MEKIMISEILIFLILIIKDEKIILIIINLALSLVLNSLLSLNPLF